MLAFQPLDKTLNLSLISSTPTPLIFFQLNAVVYYIILTIFAPMQIHFALLFPMTSSKAGDRTFTVTAAKEWNELPSYIKSAPSVDVFKKVLKTNLFPN